MDYNGLVSEIREKGFGYAYFRWRSGHHDRLVEGRHNSPIPRQAFSYLLSIPHYAILIFFDGNLPAYSSLLDTEFGDYIRFSSEASSNMYLVRIIGAALIGLRGNFISEDNRVLEVLNYPLVRGFFGGVSGLTALDVYLRKFYEKNLEQLQRSAEAIGNLRIREWLMRIHEKAPRFRIGGGYRGIIIPNYFIVRIILCLYNKLKMDPQKNK